MRGLDFLKSGNSEMQMSQQRDCGSIIARDIETLIKGIFIKVPGAIIQLWGGKFVAAFLDNANIVIPAEAVRNWNPDQDAKLTFMNKEGTPGSYTVIVNREAHTAKVTSADGKVSGMVEDVTALKSALLTLQDAYSRMGRIYKNESIDTGMVDLAGKRIIVQKYQAIRPEDITMLLDGFIIEHPQTSIFMGAHNELRVAINKFDVNFPATVFLNFNPNEKKCPIGKCDDGSTKSYTIQMDKEREGAFSVMRNIDGASFYLTDMPGLRVAICDLMSMAIKRESTYNRSKVTSVGNLSFIYKEGKELLCAFREHGCGFYVKDLLNIQGTKPVTLLGFHEDGREGEWTVKEADDGKYVFEDTAEHKAFVLDLWGVKTICQQELEKRMGEVLKPDECVQAVSVEDGVVVGEEEDVRRHKGANKSHGEKLMPTEECLPYEDSSTIMNHNLSTLENLPDSSLKGCTGWEDIAIILSQHNYKVLKVKRE